MIAHRLSTIRNADKIIAFAQGKIIEEGSHDDLMKNEDGVYFNLAKLQQTTAKSEEETASNDTATNNLEVKKQASVKDPKEVEKEKKKELAAEQKEADELGMMKIWALRKSSYY